MRQIINASHPHSLSANPNLAKISMRIKIQAPTKQDYPLTASPLITSVIPLIANLILLLLKKKVPLSPLLTSASY